MSSRVIIVGGGLAGLACARALTAAGLHARVFEASDAVGGRVRTDRVTTEDGEYLLDRGFQVYLTAYPHASAVLDHEALKLRPFYPGAIVHHDSGTDRISDPLREPIDAAANIFGSVAKPADFIKLAVLDRRLRSGTLDELWDRPDIATIDLLREHGLSKRVIERFFRPFFGGVFFDPDLVTSARMFRFTYRMFATGSTTVPAAGMGELPRQLASGLPEGTVRLNTVVSRVTPESVSLSSGETYDTDAVVIATDSSAAMRLLGQNPSGPPAIKPKSEWCPTATLWYAADSCPDTRGILHIDGTGKGPVNHAAVMSSAAPGYAPAGKSLVCANLIGVWADRVINSDADEIDTGIDPHIRTQLAGWFGSKAHRWRLIGVHRIPHALPAQPVGVLAPSSRTLLGDAWANSQIGSHAETQADATDARRGGVWVCGDWVENASIDGAIRSGGLAAKSVLASLSRQDQA